MFLCVGVSVWVHFPGRSRQRLVFTIRILGHGRCSACVSEWRPELKPTSGVAVFAGGADESLETSVVLLWEGREGGDEERVPPAVISEKTSKPQSF